MSRVVVELVDLNVVENSSSDHIIYLINLLKRSFTKKQHQFSLNFNMIGQFDQLSPQDPVFDIAISKKYDTILIPQKVGISIYNRPSSRETFHLEQLFKVEKPNTELRCMKLVDEQGEEFIYATDYSNAVVKFSVSDIMIRKVFSIIWQSEPFSNLWGLDVLNGKVYAVDNMTSVKILDCKSGATISENAPNVAEGYGIHFLSEKQAVISNSKKVEIFERDKFGNWNSIKQTQFPMEAAYAIFCEESSGLIYVCEDSQLHGLNIHVVRQNDLTLVKSFPIPSLHFGVMVDDKSGLLYVCHYESSKMKVNVYE
ncbi:predicted protein [Naegleria gruberi]|uniref:Predicted protein n=1 Tax=Naegleria gruberi TaxID=5762 RepID=D2VG65_NAEGR|nr:uncharacterized protein NAEGRDRAFT_67868 [Naegleria gruberi]EFC44218.1 predicted protein [Naegleria gruberi]|eukprot:XP_002676962.1 predicted protein [Naegleria gruberi strain NEG-M]